MQRVKRAAARLVAAALLLAGSGCAMYGHALRDVDLAVQQGRPEAALATLESLSPGFRNEALYYVNKGTLLRMSGDIDGSIAAFEAAKPLVSFQEATSVSELAGQLSLSEGTTSYQPRPFERLQVHVFQALNHLELGNWDAARVEALQIDLLLERAYKGVAPDGGDAFARYLSGIIFEGLQEDDNALIAYRKALAAYERDNAVRVPADLERRLLLLTQRFGLDDEHARYAKRFGPQRIAEFETLRETLRAGDHGELVLVAMSGLVPRRYEVSSLHQDFSSGKFYRLSLPALQDRSFGTGGASVTQQGRELGATEPVEDLSSAARRALEDEMPGLIARAIARNVVKNRIANEAGEENHGLEFLVNFASAVLENADVRSWSTLPERFHLLRLPLPAGTHEIGIRFAGDTSAGETLNVTITPRRPSVIAARRTGH